MAGLAPISLQQRIGVNGRPYVGARALFYAADTLTPITVYQDYGLGTPHPNPVETDDFGVFPAIYIDEAVEFYRMRITAADGTALSDLITLPVIGPSGGGGGSETPVDPNALFKTGYPLWLPQSGTLAGFVRMNGRTIGSALSGATERANADTEALYTFFYQGFSDAICPVIGGRGSSAASDFTAGKPITVLDMRNRGPFGLDTMGNSAANGFSGVTFAQGDATTPGATLGAALHTLTEAQLPAITLTPQVTWPDYNYNRASSSGKQTSLSSGSESANYPLTYNTTAATRSGGSIQIPQFGGGAAHNNMPPAMLGTWYIKL
jgi:hypothetical protein